VRQGLRPVLMQLTGEDLLQPGDADYFRAFDELAPDPKIAAQVADLLKALDAPAFEDREAASAALAKLGSPALLAVMRQDQAAMSAEQRARVNVLIEASSRRHFASTAEARESPSFLLDCMESSDPVIRKAAHKALQEAVHHEISFNPDLSGDELCAA